MTCEKFAQTMIDRDHQIRAKWQSDLARQELYVDWLRSECDSGADLWPELQEEIIYLDGLRKGPYLPEWKMEGVRQDIANALRKSHYA